MIKILGSSLIQLAALALLLAPQAHAKLDSGDIDVRIVSDYGYRAEQYPVSRNYDTYRAYVQARRGEEYSIRVKNRSNRRIGLVIAVDGRNILSGKKSRLRSNERMYILNPYQSATYSGWRTSKNRVNRFYFTDAGGSYAAAWGDYSAMGVIAVAAFAEKYYHKEPYHTYDDRSGGPRSSKRHAPGAAAEPGTGFGDSEWSPAVKVHFKPKKRPFARHFLKYEWRKSLCKKGVIDCYKPTRHKPTRHKPHNRFWKDDAYSRYAPFPPGYGYRNDSNR